MKINIKALHTSLTPAISDYVEKRLGSLSKFVNEKQNEATIYVELSTTTKHHHADNDLFSATANLEAGDLRVRGEASDADLYAAIDKLKDEVARELISKKEKRTSLTRWGGSKIKSIIKGFRSEKGAAVDVDIEAVGGVEGIEAEESGE